MYAHHTDTNWWWDLDTVLHTVRGVGGLGIRMLTLDTETSLYDEDRGLQVPMVLDHDYIPHTYKSFFRSYDLLDWSTQILSVNKTHTHPPLTQPLHQSDLQGFISSVGNQGVNY